MRLDERLFWLLTIVMLGAMATVQILSIRLECQTWDEGFEIASGYSFIRTGEYRISPEQPPLARLLAAIPLLWLDLTVPVADPSWQKPDDRTFGQIFLYKNRVPAEDIVFAARIPAIVTTVALGLAIVLWARALFGPWAALGSLLLFAFDPNIIAVGRYVKNDILVTLLVLLTVAAWNEYLRTRMTAALVTTGVAFGFAVCAKFSALFLLPVFALSWIMLHRGFREMLQLLKCFIVVNAVALPAVLLVYAPEWEKINIATRAYRVEHPEARRLADGIFVHTPQATWFTHKATQIGLQNHPFLVGIARFLDHASGGHQSYLLGMKSAFGWWYYFPVAFVVKTPVATLVAILLAIVLAIIDRRWLPFEFLLCLAPIVVYLPISMLNKVNTGERHLFPIYPFLFIITAAAIVHSRFRWPSIAGAVLALGLIVESFSIYPHYLSFFNVATGGPEAGPDYLLDSNIDWGQDLLKLRDYWTARGRPRLCTNYFGTADQDYYGIQHEWVPRTWQKAERESVDCLAAVSVTALHDMYDRPGAMEWIREREPIAKIGYSIYVYDLLKRR